MRFEEFKITERSWIDPALVRDYKKSGYTLLGKGRDQQAWNTPNGGLVKLFGTQKGQQGQTADQKMFQQWIDYAKKNSNNPYMPRFGAVEQFEFPPESGQTYLRVEMERLSPLPANARDLLSQFMIFVEEGRTFDYLVQIVKNRLGPKMGGYANLFKTPQLWDTVKELYQMATNNGWELDLDGENYMSRNGQVVIVDPWIAS
jgi:hypothetical protein